MWIADTSNHRVRRIDGATGIITTVAGAGTQGYSGDDGPALHAQLNSPSGVALDTSGNLYIADTGNHRIRKVERDTGLIRTFAGTGVSGAAGDGGPPLQAQLIGPRSVRFDGAGNLLFTQPGRVRMISPENVIYSVAGAVAGVPADGGEERLALGTAFDNSVGIALGHEGSIYVVEGGGKRVRKLEPARPPE